MPTNSSALSPLHRIAVLKTVDLVSSTNESDFDRPTPCDGWNLFNLVAHMTVQHRGFAAAARGSGADSAVWHVETVADAVRSDPRGVYSEAAHDVLAAFATDGAADVPFALPEFGEGAVFPGEMAIGFHFVDYVVHGWDVAAPLGAPFELPSAVVDAVTPLVLAVPDDREFRAMAGSPFAPAIAAADSDGSDGLGRILRHLGRNPLWAQSYSTVTGE